LLELWEEFQALGRPSEEWEEFYLEKMAGRSELGLNDSPQ
jgi:hypothetical protein